MVPDETSDLPTTLPEASFLNPNWKVPSEARSLRGLFPVPVFAEFPSYSLSKNADGFLQNPFWLSYCNLRKLKVLSNPQGNQVSENTDASKSGSSRQSSIILEMGRLDFSFSLYRLMRFKAIFRKTLSCS